jgi:hypothetical protein
MAERASMQVVIDFSSQGGTPQGSLQGPDGAATPFDGWLQLLAALQQCIGEPTHEPFADSDIAQTTPRPSP